MRAAPARRGPALVGPDNSRRRARAAPSRAPARQVRRDDRMTSGQDAQARPDDGRPALGADFRRERLVAPAGPLARLEGVAESPSTNAELARAVAQDPDAWPAP